MPARLLAGQAFAVLPGFAGGLNGVDDASVAGTAAQMSGEGLGHGIAVLGGALLHQRGGAHDDAGDTEATLHRPLVHEGFTQHAAHVFRHALQRDHLAALHLLGLAQAGQHRLPVHQNRAAAAASLGSATVFGGKDAQFLA